MKRAVQVVLFCWAVPLLAGVVIFLLWQRTDKSLDGGESLRLMNYDVCDMIFGAICVAIGMLALAHYVYCGYLNNVPCGRLWRRTLAMQILLLSNFAVAYGLQAIALREVPTAPFGVPSSSAGLGPL